MYARRQQTFSRFELYMKWSVIFSGVAILGGIAYIIAYAVIASKEGEEEAACRIYGVCITSTTEASVN